MFSFGNRFGRRTIAFFWLILISALIGGLIYTEQIAVLYVLVTLSLVALLLVVGFSDLEHIGGESSDSFGSPSE